MTNELNGVGKDVRASESAGESQQPSTRASEAPRQDIWEAHQQLTAGLARVRGEAVQRSEAANARLRKTATIVTLLSFGAGVFLGLSLSGRSSIRPRLCCA